MVFKAIVVLASIFVTPDGQVAHREFTDVLQGNFPTFSSIGECREGLLKYDNQIVAAAGSRLRKFIEDQSQELGATKLRNARFKLRCGKDALDQTDAD